MFPNKIIKAIGSYPKMSLGIKKTCVSRAEGVAQVVDHLPSKCKVLSSNPYMTDTKTKAKGPMHSICYNMLKDF
jgi:hypothetical protein